ncbi:alpha-galactosidase [Paenibacillus rhizovicinus]|nr:alpha-galactosidase [Paenibacillus rhizovicinus]
MEEQGLKREQMAVSHGMDGVTEYWTSFTCLTSAGCEVTDAFSVNASVGDSAVRAVYYESAWGREYTPVTVEVTGRLRIENRKGRSSADVHPLILVHGRSGAVYAYAVAWSGNWMLEIEPSDSDCAFTVRGGLASASFAKKLSAGETWTTPKVMGASSKTGSLNEISAKFHAWYETVTPRNALSDQMPVEWNHWWAYEDKWINEDVFLRNADLAAEIGVEVCTLDAGWFGSDDADEHWFDVRGDWHKVNRTRFPKGIRYLADYVHGKGMKFGLWCEIEGLGAKADLCGTHPQFVAKRDGAFLGYVCLGGEEAQRWAFATLAGMIEDYDCDWIKIDFNLDPGEGCNCGDHGHGAHDGLYAHYEGLYRVLEQIRERYPEIVLENCSSGGLRTDLGIIRQMHVNFLSDPDYSEHQLQAFWAASLVLPPQRCLHWAWSNTCGDGFPGMDFGSPELSESAFKFHMRTAMLHTTGYSHPLPRYDGHTLADMRAQIAFYKAHAREWIRGSTLYRLTPQAVRGGQGAGWNAYSFVKPAGEGTACLFVFRLEHGEASARIRLEGLEADRHYAVEDVDTGAVFVQTGAELMSEGLFFDDMQPVESRVLRLR